MAFRERVKRVLGRSSSSNSSNSSLSKKTTASTTPRDSNVYQPGEKMPPMKYRRPVQKEHKEKLESFQFSKAWRRRSDMSQYSPMGSRLPSRMNSMKSRQSMQVARVGLSPQRTREETRFRPISLNANQRAQQPATSTRPETATTDGSGNTQQTFTQQDLNSALARSHIEVPAT
ncbi:uncharacterized protein K452DRAFT_170289 [Aplosporella prunicola CBS 121167]|uniref:Uncharacterized protein n=1 Tax=Aplosporella prunicola CBS 121167 TaxID=1176127 RepID=A0A6A6BGW7_9PEZI|nr:uncharacterized protein K452DRAFT_170289 [Aplosporella prunicola CBS 121167]KAF2143392.1 hypothetical protein K452DRAFT_170289 [Aplosporella prunicola CBS 121167]